MKTTTELNQALDYINSYSIQKSKIAIILGSGLGSFADIMNDRIKIATKNIPNYPDSTVPGHAGQLVFGFLGSQALIALQGRTHYYEGYDLSQVTFVVRLLKALDVSILIITNAAGGINQFFRPGDLMLITDQINFMFDNPIRGITEQQSEAFVDMSDPYTAEYFDLVHKVALDNHIDLQSGTLFVSTGPSYETSSEVKMAYKLGADAVSMSTVPEVIVANQIGMEVIGLSCITNMATGITQSPLSHDEVTSTAQLVKNKFIKLAVGIIEQLYKYKQQIFTSSL